VIHAFRPVPAEHQSTTISARPAAGFSRSIHARSFPGLACNSELASHAGAKLSFCIVREVHNSRLRDTGQDTGRHLIKQRGRHRTCPVGLDELGYLFRRTGRERLTVCPLLLRNLFGCQFLASHWNDAAAKAQPNHRAHEDRTPQDPNVRSAAQWHPQEGVQPYTTPDRLSRKCPRSQRAHWHQRAQTPCRRDCPTRPNTLIARPASERVL
jgi:hypothetical protein